MAQVRVEPWTELDTDIWLRRSCRLRRLSLRSDYVDARQMYMRERAKLASEYYPSESWAMNRPRWFPSGWGDTV